MGQKVRLVGTNEYIIKACAEFSPELFCVLTNQPFSKIACFCYDPLIVDTIKNV